MPFLGLFSIGPVNVSWSSLELASDNKLDQGQKEYSNAQQVSQANHLVVAFEEQWIQR